VIRGDADSLGDSKPLTPLILKGAPVAGRIRKNKACSRGIDEHGSRNSARRRGTEVSGTLPSPIFLGLPRFQEAAVKCIDAAVGMGPGFPGLFVVAVS